MSTVKLPYDSGIVTIATDDVTKKRIIEEHTVSLETSLLE